MLAHQPEYPEVHGEAHRHVRGQLDVGVRVAPADPGNRPLLQELVPLREALRRPVDQAHQREIRIDGVGQPRHREREDVLVPPLGVAVPDLHPVEVVRLPVGPRPLGAERMRNEARPARLLRSLQDALGVLHVDAGAPAL